MTSVMIGLFLFCAAVLYYVYHGYGVVLRLLALGRQERAPAAVPDDALPTVTLLLTVHNEERNIERRLANILAQDFPKDRLDVLVASDGSTDRTDAMVEAYGNPVRLIRADRLGKSGTQNLAVPEARGEVVVLTDADAEFAPDFLRRVAEAFVDPTVGCVTTELHMAQLGGAVSQGQGYYWSYELKIRALESRLGILAVASGQAMAFRRSAFVPLPRDVGDDCMIPLDVALQGLRVVHLKSARAWDSMAAEASGEFRARVRMTLRNWIGTWRRGALLNPLRYPGYAWALWSHKLLRWLGPVFLIAMTVSAAVLAVEGIWIPAALMGLLYGAGLAGWWADRSGKSLPGAGTIYSFLLANLGFLVGLSKALAGQSIVQYRK